MQYCKKCYIMNDKSCIKCCIIIIILPFYNEISKPETDKYQFVTH